MKFSGLGVAVITPFTDDNAVDFPSLEKISDFLVTHDAGFLVLLGTTAESVTLSNEEKSEIVRVVKKVNMGRVPLVVGIGGYHTMRVARKIRELDTDGISGILSVSPYYNKPSQEGIYMHYKTIAESTDLPVILYNVPGRTSSNVNAETICRLANDFPNIVAVKEASGNLMQIMAIMKNKHEHFNIISGDDALTLPMLSIGATGVISVIGNAFPAEFAELIRLALRGDVEGAMKIQYRLLDFIDLAFEEGSPAGIKILMSLMGFCKPHVRLPLVKATAALEQKMRQRLEKGL